LPPTLDWKGAYGRCVQVVRCPADTSLTPPAAVAGLEPALSPPLAQAAVSVRVAASVPRPDGVG